MVIHQLVFQALQAAFELFLALLMVMSRGALGYARRYRSTPQAPVIASG